MNIIFWNIGDYGRGYSFFTKKFKALKSLIQVENPDVFCVIEGSQSQTFNRLLINLFRGANYSCFFRKGLPH